MIPSPTSSSYYSPTSSNSSPTDELGGNVLSDVDTSNVKTFPVLMQPASGKTIPIRSPRSPRSPGSPSLFGSMNNWQKFTLIGLCIGYVGYYFCRTNITLTINIILNSLPGIDKGEIGNVLSFGYLSYAIGKPVLGVFIDKYGGRFMFIFCLNWAILCTLLLTMIPIVCSREEDESGNVKYELENPDAYLVKFGLLWCLLRFGQSGGWPSLIQVLSESFPASMYGRVLGLASLSYGFGDAGVRVFLGICLGALTEKYSVGNQKPDPSGSADIWRSIFRISAICAAVLISICWLFLKRSRNVLYTDFQRRNNASSIRKSSTLGTILILLSLPKFWVVVVLSVGLTFLREAILTWGSVFLAEFIGLDYSKAAIITLFFPLVGSFGSLYGGILLDRVNPARRGLVLVSFLAVLAAFLGISTFASADHQPSALVATVFLGIVAFALMAPFSYVDAIFPLDLIENNPNTGVTVGLVNLCGYMGAIMAGHEVGYLAETQGWVFVLKFLFATATTCLAFGFVWWHFDLKQHQKRRLQPAKEVSFRLSVQS